MDQALDVRPVQASKAPRRGLTLASLWVFVAVFLPVVASLEAQLSTIDLAYHIRAGEIMLDTGDLVRTDTFTYTAAGRDWLDQQWGAQVLFAQVFRWGGWEGLAIARGVLVALIFLFALLAARVAGAGKKRAAWFALASFLLTLGGLGMRPQLFGMALFAATVWILFGRHRAPRRLWLLPLLVAVWANLHGSFFLAPLMIGLAWVDDVFHKRYGDGKRLLFVGAATTAATLVNPFGIRVWEYVYELSTNKVVTGIIQEWQPPTLRDVPGAIFYLSAAWVTAILARRRRPTPWPTLLSLGVLFFVGLFAIRGIFWWAIVAPPVLAALLAEDERLRDGSGNGRPGGKPEKPGSVFLNRLIAAFLVVMAVVFLPWWRGQVPLSPTTPLLDEAPRGITTYLQRELRPGERLFNAQIWGSWFEFILPDNPVFADSRIEVLPASVWTDYRDISRGREGWQGLLDKWGVDVVVADRGQQGDLIPIIQKDPGWRQVHRDKDGFVFVRARR